MRTSSTKISIMLIMQLLTMLPNLQAMKPSVFSSLTTFLGNSIPHETHDCKASPSWNHVCNSNPNSGSTLMESLVQEPDYMLPRDLILCIAYNLALNDGSYTKFSKINKKYYTLLNSPEVIKTIVYPKLVRELAHTIDSIKDKTKPPKASPHTFIWAHKCIAADFLTERKAGRLYFSLRYLGDSSLKLYKSIAKRPRFSTPQAMYEIITGICQIVPQLCNKDAGRAPQLLTDRRDKEIKNIYDKFLNSYSTLIRSLEQNNNNFSQLLESRLKEAHTIHLKNALAPVKLFYPPDFSSGVTLLSYAIRKGQLSHASTILFYGASPNYQYWPSRNSPLTCAILDKKNNCVPILLEYGANPNHENARGQTPLSLCLDQNNLACAKLLLSHKADPNVKNNKGDTALISAARKNLTEFVSLFIAFGAHVNQQDSQGETPLITSIKMNHPKCFELLVASKADMYLESKTRQNSLFTAINNNNLFFLETLLKNGANPNHESSYNHTPLMKTIFNKKKESIELLCKYGALINHENSRGHTPVTFSILMNRPERLRSFIDLGADANFLDKEGNTPLTYTARYGRLPCLKVLLENKALVDKTNAQGKTALACAALSGNKDCLQELLINGANIEATDAQGETAAIKAAFYNNPECLELLINNKADIHHQSSYKNTALDYAHGRCLELLIEHKAPINQLNFYGQTPLCRAAQSGNADDVYLLLRGGADPSIKNSDGETPHDVTKTKEIKRILREHGEVCTPPQEINGNQDAGTSLIIS